jgi:uncharacterized protein (TIGR00730 family)
MNSSPVSRPCVCVFCGSATGRRAVYARAARELGRLLAERELGLIYGGGSVGLMGILADAALDAGAPVIGVIPHSLARKEIVHPGLSELIVTRGMHERKAAMAERATAFLALPGGIGTFEEFFEVLTWSALGIHAKPIGLLDVEGYFTPLQVMLDHAVTEGFLRPMDRSRILIDREPRPLLQAIEQYQPRPAPRWLLPDET